MKKATAFVVAMLASVGSAQASGLNGEKTHSLEQKLRLFFMNKGMPMSSLDWATQAILQDEPTECNKNASDLLTGDASGSESLNKAIQACDGHLAPRPPSSIAQLGECRDSWQSCKDNDDLINHWKNTDNMERECKERGDYLARFGEPQWGDPSRLPFSFYRSGDDYIHDKEVVLYAPESRLQNEFGATVRVGAICMYSLTKGKVTRFILSDMTNSLLRDDWGREASP